MRFEVDGTGTANLPDVVLTAEFNAAGNRTLLAATIDAEVRKMITAAHEEARTILEHHSEALERMVDVLLEKETVDRDEVADIFSDVPKWEHAFDGSLRIKYPDNPVLPQNRQEIAAAVEKDPDESAEEVTESLKLDRKLPRTKGRPAEA